ncbi:amidohydrolase [Pontibacillus halophilus JSM 076056 = DSM 19796]|uniref:Amidohydrolase n=1 Tax=Pontibacillus halophilus JSM 076056 = DSM 19796 TaxID=1385510 RepID=A0A0A5IB36_9BACI|nr:M20 family metallopeptidase [Pontibacillus halophilus]KGX93027.1 amidohydrolase [Pontibacillus halophilus JSM 076056 = DSM 19796]
MTDVFEKLDGLYDEMVELRRHFHQYPELSFEEVETPSYIAEYHRNLGHEVREGVGGRGVVAKLVGAKPGKTVALRADFDALPIQEEVDVPFKSKVDGVMHACGHDGHTATLLGVAKALNAIQDELEGTVVFIHQHAEEYQPGGAIAMIEDGCLEGVDVIFGTHLWATEPTGKLMYREGPLTAAADRFEIKVQGKGGHGAQPHLTKDSIVIASQLVVNLQQIVSRRVDPLDEAVLSIGSFEAGNAFNVIADTVKLKGTVRTFKKDVQDLIEREMNRVIEGTCLAAGAEYYFDYVRGYPATVNHKEETELIAKLGPTIPEVTETVEYDMQMGGEDYSYYLQHVPGTFFFTGALHPDAEEVYPHHHPKFTIDERSLLIAAKTLAAATLQYVGAEQNVVKESQV